MKERKLGFEDLNSGGRPFEKAAMSPILGSQDCW